MGGGSSHSDSSQVTRTENYSFQGIEGPAVAGDGNVINMTDGGAYQFAESIGTHALQTMADQSEAAMDIAERTTRSDQTVMFTQLTRYMGGGLLLVVLLLLYLNHQGKKK